jgi:hypothetical protein
VLRDGIQIAEEGLREGLGAVQTSVISSLRINPFAEDGIYLMI